MPLENDGFLAHRGAFPAPTVATPYPAINTLRRCIHLLGNEELDNVLGALLECADNEHTFRGELRRAVSQITKDELTSARAYRTATKAALRNLAC